jgi:UDP-N-acetylmuramate-alanine ligase
MFLAASKENIESVCEHLAKVHEKDGGKLEAAEVEKALVDGIRRYGHLRVSALENAAVLPRIIAEEAKTGDVVVLLGAGDITAWAYALPAQLEALG